LSFSKAAAAEVTPLPQKDTGFTAGSEENLHEREIFHKVFFQHEENCSIFETKLIVAVGGFAIAPRQVLQLTTTGKKYRFKSSPPR
jgi:hypothetical protein